MDDAHSLYVGGLSYESNEESLREVFGEYGEIVAVKIIYDRDSRESRGFGFVTFSNSRAATAAIRSVDGAQIEGRTVRVSEVRKNLQRAAVGGQIGAESIREEVRGGAPRDLKRRGLAGSGRRPPRSIYIWCRFSITCKFCILMQRQVVECVLVVYEILVVLAL